MIRSVYNKAISSPQQNNNYAEVMRACALADTDELGYFRAAALTAPMSSIMQAKYDVPSFRRHLFEFCEEKRGPVLKRIGEPRSVRFSVYRPDDAAIRYHPRLLDQQADQRIAAQIKRTNGPIN